MNQYSMEISVINNEHLFKALESDDTDSFIFLLDE